jgi:protein involved in polysaccharide export with SLBB domain
MNGLRGALARQVGAGVALLTLLAMSGCNGFVDPTELMPVEAKPRLVNVLTHLDTAVEEEDEIYRNATEVRPSDLVYVPRDYVIGKNDMIQTSIVGLVQQDVETQVVRRVSESGKISLPMIGQIDAEGKTEAQLEQAIIQSYRDRQLIQNAQVSVVVVEARNRTFTITGSVQAVGQYAIVDSNFRLLDAIALARGVSSPTGIQYVYVIRHRDQDVSETPDTMPANAPGTQPTPDILAPRSEVPNMLPKLLQAAPEQGAANAPAQVNPADGRTVTPADGQPMQIQQGQMVPANKEPANTGTIATAPSAQNPSGFEFNDLKEPSDTRVIRVPYEPLKRGELKYNIVIRPQDFIIVPDVVVGEYYMGGHILRTGVYSLTARDITLRQAVISAGGLDQLAIPERTEIVRKVGRLKMVYSRVNLAKVFAGEEPDILLKPDDQISVGTNALAPFLAAFRAGFRVTYGFGFLYDRNFWEQNNQ